MNDINEIRYKTTKLNMVLSVNNSERLDFNSLSQEVNNIFSNKNITKDRLVWSYLESKIQGYIVEDNIEGYDLFIELVNAEIEKMKIFSDKVYYHIYEYLKNQFSIILVDNKNLYNSFQIKLYEDIDSSKVEHKRILTYRIGRTLYVNSLDRVNDWFNIHLEGIKEAFRQVFIEQFIVSVQEGRRLIKMELLSLNSNPPKLAHYLKCIDDLDRLVIKLSIEIKNQTSYVLQSLEQNITFRWISDKSELRDLFFGLKTKYKKGIFSESLNLSDFETAFNGISLLGFNKITWISSDVNSPTHNITWDLRTLIDTLFTMGKIDPRQNKYGYKKIIKAMFNYGDESKIIKTLKKQDQPNDMTDFLYDLYE